MSGLRTIVIGFGQVAAGLQQDARMADFFDHASHAAVLAAHPAFDWVGVVDPDAEARRAATETWNVPTVGDDLAAVAAATGPEVAVIAAPPGNRAAMVDALPDVQAILVEKPLDGVAGDDGSRLAAICAERGIPLLVNYWRRADRLFRCLGEGDLADYVGRPGAVFALYGNGLFNNGGHMVDFLRLLTGEVTHAQALGDPRPVDDAPLAGDLALPFALTLESGATAQFAPLDYGDYRELSLDIWGDRGRLSFFQESLNVQYYPRLENRGLENEWEVASDADEFLPSTVGDAFYRMYDNLADVARGEAEPWSPAASALRNEAILRRVLESADNGGRRLPVG